MDSFIDHIEEATEDNSHFRRVLYTGKPIQLVLMSLAPGEEIGEEVHEDGDQFVRIEEGHGVVTIDARESEITDRNGIVIPSGARHNIRNAGDKNLRLYTLHAPPHHRDGYAAATKAEAEKSHEHFDGRTTESHS
jgi:mannose-6-phosphate isomerase-like protein (cupin superfamily)